MITTRWAEAGIGLQGKHRSEGGEYYSIHVPRIGKMTRSMAWHTTIIVIKLCNQVHAPSHVLIHLSPSSHIRGHALVSTVPTSFPSVFHERERAPHHRPLSPSHRSSPMPSPSSSSLSLFFVYPLFFFARPIPFLAHPAYPSQPYPLRPHRCSLTLFPPLPRQLFILSFTQVLTTCTKHSKEVFVRCVCFLFYNNHQVNALHFSAAVSVMFSGCLELYVQWDIQNIRE
jgi:hypothetical protein